MKYLYGRSMQILLFTLVMGMAISLFDANAAETTGRTIELPVGD